MRNKMTIGGLTMALFLFTLAAGFARDQEAKTGPAGRQERLASFLELTPEQQAKFDEVRKARQEEVKAFREEMGKLRPQLRKAMKDPQADQKTIDGLIDQLSQARAAHQKSMVRGRKEIEKILTPEQFEKYRKLRFRMGMRRGLNRGFGHGHGARPGRTPRGFEDFLFDGQERF